MITIAPESPKQLDMFPREPDHTDDGAMVDWDTLTRVETQPCEACCEWTRNWPKEWGECAYKVRTGKSVAGHVFDRWTKQGDTCNQWQAAS